MHQYVCQKCHKPFESHKRDKKYCSHECYAKRFDPVTKNCEICKKDFTVAYRFRGQRTCNAQCSGKLVALSNRTRVTKQCLCCGGDYEATQSYKDQAKYCSSTCFYKHKYGRDSTIVVKTCEACGKEFEKPFIQRSIRFCSRSCGNAGEQNGMFGKPGPMLGKLAWNNGLTTKTDERLRLAGEKISIIVADKMISGSWSPPSTGFKGEHYTGIKNGGVTNYLRSSFESTYARMLDADHTVTAWEHEPFRIPYIFEGSARNYVPDFLVTRESDLFLIEVKPKMLTETEQNSTKQVAAQTWCEVNSVTYVSITEDDLMGLIPK